MVRIANTEHGKLVINLTQVLCGRTLQKRWRLIIKLLRDTEVTELSCLLDLTFRSDRLRWLTCGQSEVVEFPIHYVNGLLPLLSRFKAKFLLTASTQHQAD